MIVSLVDEDTERVWKRERVRRFGPDLQRMANRKLLMLDAAEVLSDLRIPPGNRLEALTGIRVGQHSIRVNDQWRVCFIWSQAGPAGVGPAGVEITDYH